MEMKTQIVRIDKNPDGLLGERGMFSKISGVYIFSLLKIMFSVSINRLRLENESILNEE